MVIRIEAFSMFNYKNAPSNAQSRFMTFALVLAASGLFSGLMAESSFGQSAQIVPTPSPTPVPLPKVQKTVGQPVTMTWEDGRAASMEITSPLSKVVPFPVELVENSCDSARQITCEF